MTDKPKEEDCADEKLLSHDKEGNGRQVVVSTGKELGKQLISNWGVILVAKCF